MRYLARISSPDAIALDPAESNDLAWVTLARAAELMPGAESHRVLRKIERLLAEYPESSLSPFGSSPDGSKTRSSTTRCIPE